MASNSLEASKTLQIISECLKSYQILSEHFRISQSRWENLKSSQNLCQWWFSLSLKRIPHNVGFLLTLWAIFQKLFKSCILRNFENSSQCSKTYIFIVDSWKTISLFISKFHTMQDWKSFWKNSSQSWNIFTATSSSIFWIVGGGVNEMLDFYPEG